MTAVARVSAATVSRLEQRKRPTTGALIGTLLPKDLRVHPHVCSAPVDASSNQLQDARCPRAISSRPAKAAFKPASDIVPVNRAAGNQGLGEVQSLLGVIGPSPPPLRSSANHTPQST